MSAAVDFEKTGKELRSICAEDFTNGKAKHKEQLNFAAYRQAHDPQYLGFMGKNNYGKPWGNDSSNVQSVLNGPSYWKRVYYRPDEEADRDEEEKKLKRSQSDGTLQKAGYAMIREKMKDMVEGDGRPKLRGRNPGERLNFFNTLMGKYHVKAGGQNIAWNIDRLGHRSSPKEVQYIASTYFRTDSEAILSASLKSPSRG